MLDLYILVLCDMFHKLEALIACIYVEFAKHFLPVSVQHQAKHLELGMHIVPILHMHR
jgi:hypothetical protein